MERIERINSAYDLEYDYYRKNMPALEKSVDTEQSIEIYEKIFSSRKEFTILGLDSYIKLSKKSLNKIADMINAYPQEYILFTEHQILDDEKFDKLLEKEGDKLNPIFIPEPENENNIHDINEGLKKAENIDDVINKDTYKICSYLYLFLILCSFCNILFLIYNMTKTDLGFIFFTGYTLYLFACLMFTGIFGFIKCKQNDFTGFVLRTTTFLVPISGLVAIIIFFASSSVPLRVFWMKIIVDIITIIIGVILILYITGLIKIKINHDSKKEQLIKNEDTQV